jgi:hypothetical protein
MLGALLYLKLTSFKNLVWSRVRRLRQPKYLVGAIVGAAYFYFVFVHGLGRHHAAGAGGPASFGVMPHDTGALLLNLGAVGLLAVVAFMWVLPKQNPGLAFSEAEIAFLFSAPVKRRGLIHYKLLSGQLTVLLQSLFFPLIFNSRGLASGHAPALFVGWWLILTTINLHYLGSSLTIARLIEGGVSAGRRRAVILGGIALAVAFTVIRVGHASRGPTPADLAGFDPLVRWLTAVLDGGLLHWLLMPFKLVLRPLVSTTPRDMLIALGPALLVLAAHYLWVSRMEVTFEEAAVIRAEKRAARRAQLRAGNYRLGGGPAKGRRAPFRLAASGRPEIAFLWKNLLSVPPYLNGRNWLRCAGAIALAGFWAGRHGGPYHTVLTMAGVASGIIGFYIVLFGPLVARQDLRNDLPNVDILRSYPLPGWQLLLGELLAPIALLTGLIWLAVLTAALAFPAGSGAPEAVSSPALRATVAAGIALLAPVVIALQLLVPNAAAILFPAWTQATRHRSGGGGIELLGQRMIFVFGQIAVIVGLFVPAALLAFAVFVMAHGCFFLLAHAGIAIGAPTSNMIAAAIAFVAVLAVLLGEVMGGVWWLGRRFERFDLSAELSS